VFLYTFLCTFLGGESLIDLREYGLTPTMAAQNDTGEPARVTAVLRERYELITANGAAFGRLKGGAYYDIDPETYPTVGDFVTLRENDPAMDGDRIIIRTLPRFSLFVRRAGNDRARSQYQKAVHEQAIAANFDICFIVTSMNRDLNMARLERYLSQAWQSGAIPVVALTKADLADDFTLTVETVKAAVPGVEVIAVSVVTGLGMDAVRAIMKPSTTAVLLGSSGAGKSSLVNALSCGDVMRVNAIREDDAHGRHTTTHRQMIRLPWGAMIIDTPGMRELGMWDAGEGIDMTFPDVEEMLARGCRFSDCSHEREPGCAIRAAIQSGELTEERWRSYINLQKETKFAQDKAAYLRAKTKRFKEISKANTRRDWNA
jgi:ribosome biogenesis GTPase